MQELYSSFTDTLATYPWAETLIAIAGLLLLAWLVNWIARAILRLIFSRRLSKDEQQRGAQLRMPQLRAIARFANIAPALVIAAGIGSVPGLPEIIVAITRNVCGAFIIVTIAVAAGHLLDYANLVYQRRPDAPNKPIKGYLQVLKLVLYIIAALLTIATLVDQNPLILLSGLGAMAAVLMLVFQDTILSLVASVQISSNGSVRVGDWIEMPQVNADGDVVDIALHTVTVSNWDKTLTTFPTRKLVSESFKNWRGMSQSGGRRIKRSLYLDQTSVRFLSDEEIAHLHRFAVLDNYLDEKAAELAEWNSSLIEQGKDPINSRRVTNLGTFRAYMNHYLRNHPGIHQEMTLLVRQLQPGPTGVPLELYCFTNTVAWAQYEGIQSDIFDHMLAILPEFGLRVFQQPSGADLHDISQHNPLLLAAAPQETQ